MSLDSLLYEVEAFREEMEGYVEEMDSRHGLSLNTPEEVLKYVEEYGISSVRIWFTDMIGFLKSFSITPKELPGAFSEGMGFDGSSIDGYQRIQESDMVAFPIASTAQVLPFRPGGSRSLRMFAEIRTPDGKPYESDPRFILAKNLERLKEQGFSHMNIGPEAEFFIFDNVQYDANEHESYYSIDSIEGAWNTGTDEGPNLGHKLRYKEG